MGTRDKRYVERYLEDMPYMPSMKQNDRRKNAYIVSDNSRPENWYPGSAMDRLVRAEDLGREYERIVREYIAKYERYANAETDALDEPLPDEPDWIGDDEHVASEMLALSGRLVRGTMAENAAARFVTEMREYHVMSADAAERLGGYNGDIDEDHGIDFIAVSDSGRLIAYQVKTSDSAASNYSGDAERMIVVDMETGKTAEKRL